MGLNIYKTFAANSDKEESGVEVEIGKDAYITVARSGNKKYSRMLTKAFESNKYTLDRKDAAADAKAEAIIIDIMAKTILLGWRGLLDQDDKDMPYTFEKAKEMLAIKDFRMLVSKQSEDFSRFRQVTEEADSKNL